MSKNSRPKEHDSPIDLKDPLGLEAWITEVYEFNAAVRDGPCLTVAFTKFYANLIPYVGYGLDMVQGQQTDVMGNLGTTLDSLKGSWASLQRPLSKVQQRQYTEGVKTHF